MKINNIKAWHRKLTKKKIDKKKKIAVQKIDYTSSINGLCGSIGVARIFDWGGPNPQKFGCLHRNWEWILGRNRKFERFFRPNSGDLQKKKKKKKKKKVFTEIESGFSAETVSFTVTLLFNYCYVRNYWKKTATKHRQAMLS